MVLPHLFMGETEEAANNNNAYLQQQQRTAVHDQANSMRQAPQQQQQDLTQQQLQSMMMVAAPTPNAIPFLLHQQAMSQQAQQQQQQQLPSSLTLQGMQHYQLQQQQQQQQSGDLFARYQSPPPPPPPQQQQHFFDPATTRADSSSLLSAAIAGHHPSYQDMLYMHQQQPQQQQQRGGSDAAAFNMSLGGFGSAAAMGQAYSMTGVQQPLQQLQQHQHQQQFGQQQQIWMNEPSPSSLQQASFQEQLQHQLMSGGAAYYLPQQQQQQFEQQRRRRSSMSSTGSLSPIGPGRRPSFGNSSATALFDYARFMASGSAQPPVAPLTHSQQQQQQQQDQDDAKLGGGDGGGSTSGQMPPPLLRKEKKKRTKGFPEKLMQAMMENANENAVAWLPDGKSFVIVSPDLFVNEVLSSVFKQAKYASFVRKLHRWGFVRLTSGTGTDCFHHPLFNKNRREWAAKITCAPVREGSNKDSAGGVARPQPRNVAGGPDKPPSLAGVERFIRAKAAAAAAATAMAAQSVVVKGKSKSLPSMPEDKIYFPTQIKGDGGGRRDPFAGMPGGATMDPVKEIPSKDQLPSSEVDDERLGSGSTAV